jgi:hypothetical protein
MEPIKPLPGMKPMKPMEPLQWLPFVRPGVAGERPWWPAKLGTPEAAGGQDDVRYAYFADERRLAVERGDDVIVYDTADHRIHGVAQQQSGSGRSSLLFTSQHGTVPLDALKIVDVVRAGD